MQLLFYSILLNFYRIIFFFKSITTAGGEISCKSHQHLSQFLSHILWSFSLLVIHALPLTFLGFVLLIMRKDDTQSSLVEAYSKLVIIRHDNGTTGLRSQHNFSWLYFCDPKIMRVPMRNYINSKCNSKCKQYFKDIGDSETLSWLSYSFSHAFQSTPCLLVTWIWLSQLLSHPEKNSSSHPETNRHEIRQLTVVSQKLPLI